MLDINEIIRVGLSRSKQLPLVTVNSFVETSEILDKFPVSFHFQLKNIC
jgi:hypothetical protein